MPSIEEKFETVQQKTAGEQSDIERLAERASYEKTIAELRSRVGTLEHEKLELERGGGADENLSGYISALQQENAALKLDIAEQTRRAETDPHTGLLNKDGLENRVRPLHAVFAHQRSAHEKRGESPMSLNLIVVDFDHFKKINDTYGHLAGDAALKHVGNILLKSVRENDVVARWGGDEFVVALVSQENASMIDESRAIVAEKLRQAIANEPLVYEGKQISLTASLGAAKARHGESFEDFFNRADHAASVAKERGRNTVALE
jgi:diguanylate cyclase